MYFEWDEAKRQKNIEKHKVDFVRAAQIFKGEYLTTPDTRAEYGEDRFISLGMVGDECFVVVHTERDGATRLISAWKGGRDERRHYEAGIARGHREDE